MSRLLHAAARPPEWPLIKNILDEYGLSAIAFVAEWKAAQQQAKPVAYIHRKGNFREVSQHPLLGGENARGWTEEPLYTTPPTAQREWVGLTNEDWEQIHDKKDTALDTFQQGAVWAADKLKELNT